MSHSLHLLVLDEELPFPLSSGKRIRTYQLWKHLAAYHQITLVCPQNLNHDEQTLAQQEMAHLGIRCIFINAFIAIKTGWRFYGRLLQNQFSTWPYSVASHATRNYQRAIQRLLQTESFDLCHAEWTPYAACFRTCRLPWVVMAHNVEYRIWQRSAAVETNPMKRWFFHQQAKRFERFESWAYQTANRTIAVSQTDADWIQNRFGVPSVAVVKNGVDVRSFEPPANNQRQPKQLLFLGSLDWRPNQDAVRLLLEDLFPKIRQRIPDAKLLIVGRKPPSWLQRRTISEKQVELHADVLDVRPFLWQSRLMVVPLRIGSGSRIKILEALAAKLPVVSTRIGAEGLDLSPGLYLQIVETPSQMIEPIVHTIQNQAQVCATVDMGWQQLQQKHAWDQLANQLNQIWHQVVEEANVAWPVRRPA